MIEQIGDEGPLKWFATMLDQDGDGSVIDDLIGFAGKLQPRQPILSAPIKPSVGQVQFQRGGHGPNAAGPRWAAGGRYEASYGVQ